MSATIIAKLLLVPICLACSASAAFAQDTASSAGDKVDRAAEALSAGAAAEARIAGLKEKKARRSEARILLHSANILQALGARPAEQNDTLTDAERWISLARAEGVITKAPPLRGRALGPSYRRSLINPAKSYSVEQLFLAGTMAKIVVVPGADINLTVSVTGANNQPICQKTVSKVPQSCVWHPVFTERHRLTVVNQGSRAGEFLVITN